MLSRLSSRTVCTVRSAARLNAVAQPAALRRASTQSVMHSKFAKKWIAPEAMPVAVLARFAAEFPNSFAHSCLLCCVQRCRDILHLLLRASAAQPDCVHGQGDAPAHNAFVLASGARRDLARQRHGWSAQGRWWSRNLDDPEVRACFSLLNFLPEC